VCHQGLVKGEEATRCGQHEAVDLRRPIYSATLRRTRPLLDAGGQACQRRRGVSMATPKRSEGCKTTPKKFSKRSDHL